MKQSVSSLTFRLKEKVLEYRARIRFRINDTLGYHIVYAYDCQNIEIENVRITEPSTWTVKLECCRDVRVKDVVIDNNVYTANSDGIDICGSSDVSIDHCFIVTGDDGIVLKSSFGEIRNVSVSNCTIMSLANNFKIGTETGHDVTNVSVKDCHFFAADIMGGYSGIAIESADGANISGITVSDITMDGAPSALLIWLGSRLDVSKGSDGKTVGSVSGVRVRNIYARNIDIASAIVGCEYQGESYKVRDVLLENFYLEYRNCKEETDIYEGKGDNVLHANMSGYPEITRVSHFYLFAHELSLYHDLQVYGLYAYMAESVTINNFVVKPRSVNAGPFGNVGSNDLRDGLENIVIQ